MSDAVDLHNALREAGYLPAQHDRNFSSCGSEHYNLMTRLEEELGLGSAIRIQELEVECENLENERDDAINELHDLQKQYDALREELGKVAG